jgi:hypothetical protein
MKKLKDLFWEKLPYVWALLWAVIITLVSIGGLVWAINWVVDLIEVIL